MPLFFYFLLKVMLCSAVLFGYYHLFLRNKVYHAYNRFYLLAAVAISLLAPLLNFNLLLSVGIGDTSPIKLLQAVSSSDEYLEEIIIYSHRNNISTSHVLVVVYIIVSLFLMVGLIKLLALIFSILKTGSSRQLNDVVFIQSDAKGTPFSFFKFIFWNNAIDINSATGKQIFAHELAHVRENHSADKLFINLALIVCWINPVFWLIKKELNMIHEFIADKKAVANNDAQALAAMIVTSAYPKHSYLLTNHFFYSPIKRRLQMLSNYNTKNAGYFYRILALPFILFLVAAISIKAKSSFDNIINPDKKITVVIDAGHGGHDGGAKALDGSFEKDLTLAIIKKIKALNKSSNINIILTREEDIYQSPKEKAEIVKNAGAELFISVHAATGPSASQNSLSGLEVYVARDSFNNSFASKLFASSVIENFKSNYKLAVAPNPMQRKVGIWVLQANDCPSVLIEAGFINNKKDLSYLQTEEAKDAFAKNILVSIVQYANEINKRPVAPTTAIQVDTFPSLDSSPKYYKGEKIKRIKVNQDTDNVKLTLTSGKSVLITLDEAEKLNLLLPPPPPPAPPAPPAMVEKSSPAEPPAPPIPPAPPKPPVKNKNGNDNRNNDINLKSNKSINVSPEINLTDKPVLVELQPLVILDGIEIAYAEIKKINPNEIKSVNVLKGEQASKKYSGKNSVNGVIEINTKVNIVITKSATNNNLETTENQKNR